MVVLINLLNHVTITCLCENNFKFESLKKRKWIKKKKIIDLCKFLVFLWNKLCKLRINKLKYYFQILKIYKNLFYDIY